MMDVILLHDVKALGQQGAVVPVKPGYARNFLLPRGLAVPATAASLRALETRQRDAQAQQARQRKQADHVKRAIEGRSLTLKLALGEGDKPFGSITANDLVEALAREQITVEKHAVHLEQPIKALGIYEIPVRVHPDVTATLKLWVVKG